MHFSRFVIVGVSTSAQVDSGFGRPVLLSSLKVPIPECKFKHLLALADPAIFVCEEYAVSHADLRSTIITRMAASAAPGSVVPRLVSEFAEIPGFYASLISVLCELELPNDQAKRLWHRAVMHRQELEATLGRTVDTRVALLEILVAEPAFGSNPKISDIVRDEQRRRDAFYDEVTGLHNRRYVTGCIERELSRSSRYDLSFSLVFVDMDGFKAVNDSFGHSVGDELLRAFGSHLRHMMRVEDVVARYGGDEFLILMPRTETDGAERFARRLLDAQPEMLSTFAVPVAFSAGIASFPVDGRTAADLVDVADRRLYEAKAAGKATYRSRSDAEHRRYDRYLVGLPVDVDLGEGRPLRASTRDLSVGGLSLETEEPIEVGRTLRLRVHNATDGRVYQLSTKIVWLRELPERATYRIGTMYGRDSDDVGHQLVETLRDTGAHRGSA